MAYLFYTFLFAFLILSTGTASLLLHNTTIHN